MGSAPIRRDFPKFGKLGQDSVENDTPIQVSANRVLAGETKSLTCEEPSEAASKLLEGAEELLPTAKSGNELDGLDLAITYYRDAYNLTLPGQQAWVTASFGLAQALQKKQSHCSNPQEAESHLEEAIEIYEQVVFLTSEGDPVHDKAVTLLSQILHARSEKQQAEHNVADSLEPQVAGGQDIVPPNPSSGVTPEDITTDAPEGEGDVVLLYLASARSSYAEFKKERNPDSLDLVISWYRSALELTPLGHADWVTVALETAEALEASRGSSGGAEGEVTCLNEVIKIYEQVVCFTSHDGEYGVAVTPRLFRVLRLRYELQMGGINKSPVSPGQGNAGDVEGSLSNEEAIELASVYLSSAEEYLSMLETEQDSDALDLMISSYRDAIRLLPPSHSFWVSTSLNLVEALREKEIICGGPWGAYLDEAVEICERVLGSLPLHSDDHSKAASRLFQLLQMRHHTRDHVPPPGPTHLHVKEHNVLPNLTPIHSWEGEYDSLGIEEKPELANFYLSSARDSLLTFRAEDNYESSDLQRAISSYRSAVSLMVPASPSWFEASLELGDALEEMSHKFSVLPSRDVYRQEAIEIYRRMLHSIPHNDGNRGELILCFSWAHLTSKHVEDPLTVVVFMMPHLHNHINSTAQAFEQTENPYFLDRLIFWLRKVQRVTFGDSSLRLVLSLLRRCGNDTIPDVRSLKEALQIYEQVLPRISEDKLELERWLNLLVSIAQAAGNPQLRQPELSMRFYRTTLNAMRRVAAVLSPTLYLEEIVQVQSNLAQLLITPHVNQLEHPLPQTFDDINEAIGHLTEVLRYSEALQLPERAHDAGQLARLLFVRRAITHDIADFEREIDLFRKAVYGCEIHRPICREFLETFLPSLSQRFERTNDPGSAEEAITHCEEIATFLRSCPADTGSDIPSQLKRVEDTIRKIEQQHKLRDAMFPRGENAFAEQRALLFGIRSKETHELDATTRSVANLDYSLNRISELTSRFQATGELEHLVQAEAILVDQLEGMETDRGSIASMGQGLPPIRGGSSHHIDVAIRVTEAAFEIEKLAPKSQIISYGTLPLTLASLYMMRQDLGIKLQDLKRVVTLISELPYLENPNSIAILWEARRRIFMEHVSGGDFEGAFCGLGFDDIDSMSEAIRNSLTQLHYLAQISPDTRASLQTIQYQRTAASKLSLFVLHLLIFAGEISMSPTRLLQVALMTLDESRSIVWTQATRRRHPADEVAEIAPELATKLRELSHALSNPIQNQGYLHELTHPGAPLSRPIIASSSATTTTALPPLVTRRNVQKEWDDVVDQIRCITGFEDFLMPNSSNELLGVACEGPVVILVPVLRLSKSIALILCMSNPKDRANGGKGEEDEKGKEKEKEKERGAPRPVYHTTIFLEIGSEELLSLRQRLGTSLDARNRRVPSPQTPQEVDEEARAGKVKRKEVEEDSDIDYVLTTLWTKVTQPVIDFLAPEVEKPDIDHRDHIWWCPMGEFAFMPLHAAGTTDGRFHVSDFFISSYTPTLTGLTEARNRPTPPPESTKVLAAIQSNPGKGWGRLPDVKVELEEVHKFVPKQHLISLSHTPGHSELIPSAENEMHDIDLEGVHTTCANILAHLPTASVLHLACHGSQDRSDALRNGFILRDAEELTVEMLMKSQEEPGSGGRCIAILSACDTAAIDEKQPDEWINLANAMLFVGFRSVLATMWPMGDPDGPIIARAIYSDLFSPEVNGDLSKFCLATVLDRVMREMRQAGYSCDRWATFIHIGA